MRVRLVPRAARGAMLVAAISAVAAGGFAASATAATATTTTTTARAATATAAAATARAARATAAAATATAAAATARAARATAAAATATAATSTAAMSTIVVANDTAVAEQAVPVDLTFSGINNLAGSAEVEAVVRPAGGLACQNSYQDDISAIGDEDTAILGPGAETVPAAEAYQVSATYKPATPGSYQVCAWLAQSVNGSDQAVAGPGTVSFTVRGPQVTQLTVAVPKDLLPGSVFQIAYTTQTDQPLSLFSALKKTGGLPCAASYELETQQAQPESTLLGVGSPLVYGGPTTSTVTTKQKTGTYLLCTWVEGPNGQEVDDSTITPITVGTPAAPVAPKPALAVTKVRASRRHGVSVTGSTAAGFTGRLLVTAACGSSTTRRAATAQGRRFSASVGLPRGCRRARDVKLSVSWAGSSAWSKQSVSKSVVIGA